MGKSLSFWCEQCNSLKRLKTSKEIDDIIYNELECGHDINMLLYELKRSGFPLEKKVRSKLNELEIKTFNFRFFTKDQYGKDISHDLDASGDIVRIENVDTVDENIKGNLILDIMGEVKNWNGYKICFFEESKEIVKLAFPNFLGENFNFNIFAGGHIIFSDFVTRFGNIPLAIDVNCLHTKSDNIGYEINEEKYGGNYIIYDVTDNKLIPACEYLYSRSSGFPKDLLIRGCFPIIFTNAKIYKISDDADTCNTVDNFIYIHACRTPNEFPITTKKEEFLPILITNFNGIDSAAKLIKEMVKIIIEEFQNIVNDQEKVKEEYVKHQNILEIEVEK